MKVACTEIAAFLKSEIATSVQKLARKKITPKLVTILVGNSGEQLSFVTIKQKVAKELGINFELIHLRSEPPFLKFATMLREKAHAADTTGIIIQQPLSAHLQTDTIYNYIPPLKDIEGHKAKSPFIAPIGLTVLTILKYIYDKQVLNDELFVTDKDIPVFKQILKHKKIVLIGRGLTGGSPIDKTLTHFKINHININSKTPDPEQYIKEADIIVTAVGKHIVKSSMLKPGVTLINLGLHKEGSKLIGDYHEDDVENIASFYTATPKGTGPIDVLYLYKNLIDATLLQHQIR